MMVEAQEVAHMLGIQFKVSLQKRVQGAESVGKHKTSMLQDIEAGRPIEKNALVGSVIELGRIVGISTPYIETVYACISLLAKTLQDHSGSLKIQTSL